MLLTDPWRQLLTFTFCICRYLTSVVNTINPCTLQIVKCSFQAREICLLFAVKIEFFSDSVGSFVHVNEQIRLIVSRRHRDMRICSAAFLNFPLPQWPVRTCAFAAHIHGFCCSSNFQVRAMHDTVKLRRRAGSSPFSGGRPQPAAERRESR